MGRRPMWECSVLLTDRDRGPVAWPREADTCSAASGAAHMRERERDCDRERGWSWTPNGAMSWGDGPFPRRVCSRHSPGRPPCATRRLWRNNSRTGKR
jgi:hypothetical protein